MPEVSVIIPNYNHGLYLRQRIDSVLNQTYDDFEVIILDDCSTDNSRQVIEDYRTNIKVKHIVYNEVNTGSTFRQWQTGIELATGQYIWIAESDDWCEPTFLENIVPHLLLRKDCVIGFCQSYCVVGNDIKAQSSYGLLEDYIQGEEFISKFMVSGNAIYNASMAVWKRAAYKEITKDFIEYKFCGDWLFWIELCTVGAVFISGRLLNYFRKHDKDVSGTVYSTGYNYVEELRLLMAIRDRKLIDQELYKSQIARRFFDYKRKKSKIAPEFRKDIEKWFIKDVSYNYLYKKHLMLSLQYKGYELVKNLIKKYR